MRARGADRHGVVVLACRSLVRNHGEGAAELFLDLYGRGLVDGAKIRYYQALDELL